MGFITACVIVLVLALIAAVGAGLMGLTGLFAVVLPYLAFAIFVIGVAYRIANWGKSPVPFNIATTCGQSKSLDFIKWNPIECPRSRPALYFRMFLEVVFFRSLFRNSKATLEKDGNLTYQWEKWLWIFAILFHWGFFFTLLRHLRFFTAKVPGLITALDKIDGFILIDLHHYYITGFMFFAGVGLLLLRRLCLHKVRYISLFNDYFPLVLLLGIGCSGMAMRYAGATRVDVTGIREVMVGLMTFHPVVPAAGALNVFFYIHLTLVCTLLIYFPWGKLMHAVGVFMSPTRNMCTNSREVRHVNPWNPVVEFHSYADYEDEFRDRMVKFGVSVEKTIEEAEAEKEAERKALEESLS